MTSLKSLLRATVGALTLTLICAIPLPADAQVRAALTRDMDSVARGTRHVEMGQILFSTGQFNESSAITPAIPPGKRLLVQSISTHTVLTDNQSVMEFRLTITPGTVARFWIGQVFQAASTSGSNQRHFTGNLDVNMFINSGETLEFFVFRNDNLGQSSTNFSRFTVLGYLVDITP